MVSPLVSIIVPIYNMEKYLSKCLDSLLDQTLQHIEIICVDDGSTDNSLKIIQKYAQKDKRIQYVHQKNQGVSAARNAGMKVSHASYLMFCDPDDWYDKNMCKKMYQAIVQNNVDFVCCGINIIYETDSHLKKSDDNYYQIKFKGIQSACDDIFPKIDGSLCNKIFKKSLVNKYHIVFPVGLLYEDYCFFFKYFSISKNIYFIQEALYNYIRHLGSIMNVTFHGGESALDHLDIMINVFNFLKENQLWDKWEKTFYEGFLGCFFLAYTYLLKNKKNKAFDKAIPFMKQFSLDRVKLALPEDKMAFWCDILNRRYRYEIKELKIFGLTLFKFKSFTIKTSVMIFGIQVYSRKVKKNKEIYSVLYLPVFKRKILI